KVYNYSLTGGANPNLEITVNDGPKLTLHNIDLDKGSFRIDTDDLNLRNGRNEIKITLTKEPKVTFTFNIILSAAKGPSVDKIKLYTHQKSNDQEELTKKPSDSNYATGSRFLSKMEFEVTGA